MAGRMIVVEPWEKHLLCAGMQPTRVAMLADRFRDLEDGWAKWRAICDALVQELGAAEEASDRAPKQRAPTVSQWRAENDQLRARVAELELRVAGGGAMADDDPRCPRCYSVDAGRRSGLCVTCTGAVARGDSR